MDTKEIGTIIKERRKHLGVNQQTQSQLLHIDENDDFGILLATAQEDTIGAVTIKPID